MDGSTDGSGGVMMVRRVVVIIVIVFIFVVARVHELLVTVSWGGIGVFETVIVVVVVVVVVCLLVTSDAADDDGTAVPAVRVIVFRQRVIISTFAPVPVPPVTPVLILLIPVPYLLVLVSSHLALPDTSPVCLVYTSPAPKE